MRFIIRGKRWEFDLDVGRREEATEAEENGPTSIAGDSIYADRADIGIGFTLPSTRYDD